MVAHRRARPASGGPSGDCQERGVARRGWHTPPVSSELPGLGDGIQALSEVGTEAPPITDPRTQAVYDKHVAQVDSAQLDLVNHAWSQKRFVAIFTAHEARYERVAQQTDVPAVLVAALHFRESGGDFGTYLHNGEKLGQVTTLVPKGILFDAWEPAAVHALTKFSGLREQLGLSAGSTDLAAMATFAEHYNGLGYHHRGIASPYVYSGTDAYQKGKYVADGQFDAQAVDKQLGVMAMVKLGQAATDGGAQKPTPKATTPPAAVVHDLGTDLLGLGSRGAAVAALQRALSGVGHALVPDGIFGPLTASAVRAFQAAKGLVVDGLVGPQTRRALRP